MPYKRQPITRSTAHELFTKFQKAGLQSSELYYLYWMTSQAAMPHRNDTPVPVEIPLIVMVSEIRSSGSEVVTSVFHA
jgi:hypothetical protein